MTRGGGTRMVVGAAWIDGAGWLEHSFDAKYARSMVERIQASSSFNCNTPLLLSCCRLLQM